MSSRLADFLKGLTRNDFREIMAFMTLTSVFIFMFLIVFIQIWWELPDPAQRFGDIILGFLFGIAKTVMDYFFKSTEKLTEQK